MARYNTVASVGSLNTTTALSTPSQGLFTTFTGSAPYTVTVANPVLYSGISQTFYNSTSGTITLSTPSGSFIGPSASGATFAMPTGTTVTLTSDGSSYVVTAENGGVLVATSGTFSGTLTANAAVTINPTSGAVSIAPTTTGNINNMTIGGTTRAAGNFTSLNANANTGSTGTGSGTIIVTGGIGVSENIFLGGILSTGSTSYSKLASGNDSQRPTGAAGYLRYNTSRLYLEEHDGSTWAPAGGYGFYHVDVTNTNYNAGAFDCCWVNTNSSPVTITLPGSPSKGEVIRFFDVARTFQTRNLTVARNGQLIQGDAADLTVNVEGAAFELMYFNSTYGWRIFAV